MNVLAIDNGTTGTVAFITSYSQSTIFFETPIIHVPNYTKPERKKKKTKDGKKTELVQAMTSRLDFDKFNKFLFNTIGDDTIVILERPRVNPGQFKTTINAVRCMEATCIALEQNNLQYRFLDSRSWQKKYLPDVLESNKKPRVKKGAKKSEDIPAEKPKKEPSGSEKLKKASMELGIRLFPQHEALIRKHGDADSLLMAKYIMETEKELWE
jgi:hypothetical protein